MTYDYLYIFVRCFPISANSIVLLRNSNLIGSAYTITYLM